MTTSTPISLGVPPLNHSFLDLLPREVQESILLTFLDAKSIDAARLACESINSRFRKFTPLRVNYDHLLKNNPRIRWTIRKIEKCDEIIVGELNKELSRIREAFSTQANLKTRLINIREGHFSVSQMSFPIPELEHSYHIICSEKGKIHLIQEEKFLQYTINLENASLSVAKDFKESKSVFSGGKGLFKEQEIWEESSSFPKIIRIETFDSRDTLVIRSVSSDPKGFKELVFPKGTRIFDFLVLPEGNLAVATDLGLQFQTRKNELIAQFPFIFESIALSNNNDKLYGLNKGEEGTLILTILDFVETGRAQENIICKRSPQTLLERINYAWRLFRTEYSEIIEPLDKFHITDDQLTPFRFTAAPLLFGLGLYLESWALNSLALPIITGLAVLLIAFSLPSGQLYLKSLGVAALKISATIFAIFFGLKKIKQSEVFNL